MKADLKKTGDTVLVFYLMFLMLSSCFVLLAGDTSLGMLGSSAGVLGAFLFVFYFFRRDLSWNIIFESGTEKMTVKIFLFSLVFLFGAQIFFSILAMGMEQILAPFGMSIQGEVESASAAEIHPIELWYMVFFGPIVEELMFRGIVLQTLKKYGKSFAIFASALLFAVYHGNLPQALFAFAMGILFAYISVEYSILWSLVIHIFNNLNTVVLNWIGRQTGGGRMADWIDGMYFLCLMIVGGYFFFRRKKIKAYWSRNWAEQGCVSCFFRTGTILIFLILNGMIALAGIL